MATKYNSEGRVPANYPGLFNARENRMITHNYSVVKGDEDEALSLASDDGVTHVVVNATTTVELDLPKAVLNKGRLIYLKVEGLGDVDVTEESAAIVDLAGVTGSIQIFCTGSEYIQVF